MLRVNFAEVIGLPLQSLYESVAKLNDLLAGKLILKVLQVGIVLHLLLHLFARYLSLVERVHHYSDFLEGHPLLQQKVLQLVQCHVFWILSSFNVGNAHKGVMYQLHLPVRLQHRCKLLKVNLFSLLSEEQID